MTRWLPRPSSSFSDARVTVARLAWLLAAGVLATAACRPLALVLPPTTTPTPSSAPAAPDTLQGAGNPPGPVIALAAMPGDELLAGVGPIGDPETGLTWQLYRGRGDNWERLTWPDEAVPRSLHVSPAGDMMFAVPFSSALFGAGQAWGLMRSTDGGRSWHQVLKGLDDPYVMGLALSPAFDEDHTLAVVTWRSGVYLSANGGDTWQQLPYHHQIEPSGGANPYDIAVALSPDFRGDAAPGRPIEQGLVIASFGHGLRQWNVKRGDWRSVPFTVTTRLEDYDPPSAPLAAGAIAFSPQFASDGVLYLYSGYAGLLRSTDAGETWRVAGRPLPTPSPPTGDFSLAVASALEAYVLLPVRQEIGGPEQATTEPNTGRGHVLYRTRDGGSSWKVLKSPPDVGQVSAFALVHDEQGRVLLHLGGSRGGVSTHLADALVWE
jgi:hypothetical protein